MTMPDVTTTLTDEQKVAMNIISMNTTINEMQTDVRKHHKVLIEGNGELPLVEKVRNLEAFANTYKFWQRTIAVAIVMQTVTFGTAAIVYFVRLYPILDKLAKMP